MKTFEELCQENYSRIYKYIFSMTGSKESTEDLIQEVFMVAYEKGETFLQHEKPVAFLYKTARNMSLTHLKNLKRQRISSMEYLSENIPKEDTDLCETLLMELDRKIDETAYTGEVIANLNANQHNLYKQRYIDGKSIKEIASEQGVSETAMRMRLVRLRREIQSIIKKLKLGEK
ncbi:RNA polymerase sigma factor [Acetivibrio mesophilus]|uniref:RNA polymerase sigma factor n=1 Tax=Acetivibrio mesophilus TaxID=2487273 RepID=A0A4V1K242_9FIRM|nr:RNA polymerase sigma factor [Acetivibrio mesophilus]ODM27778.1 RNA polymerase subunit sigma-24 [Clostridium sp. Bc-iso-3]RXE58979.1 RNA polymerase sigma factor [Acetivibrio mesophilus]HHV29341.1 RNA polymerase sigma factor [Clostridium sp.]